MKIKYLGAARTVTGSCYIIEAGGKRFAIDCGMHQGNAEIEKRNWDTEIYKPSDIEFFLLTHAHIDHSGLLPRMVQKGFRGKIYTTPPTVDLLKIMLMDSAHIQEMEAQWKTKKQLRHGDKLMKPLYTQRDAEAVSPLFEAVPYDAPLEPFAGLRVIFRDAGHILGASLIEIYHDGGGSPMKLVFSGDIGRPSQLMMDNPTAITEADYLFMESTYGNRDHKNEAESLDELAEAIAYSYGRGEKIIIPAFAVERTQEMIYSLHLLAASGRLPRDIPVYVDSPLAIQATEIFKRYAASYFDDEAQAMIKKGDDPLKLPQLRYTLSTQDSMAINSSPGPAVVISANGMANAGRIKHHLRHNLWREGASIVFVGFQAQGTTGRRIIDGARTIRMFNEDIAVKARVFTINGFSAHAGRSQLLEWLGNFRSPGMQVFLVHGEYTAQQELARAITDRYGFKVVIPDYLEETTLAAGEELQRTRYPEKAAPRIDWEFLMNEMDEKLRKLKDRRPQLETKPWVEQTDLRDRMLELSRGLSRIISES